MSVVGLFARSMPAIDRAVQVGIAGNRVISVSFPRDPPPDADPDHPLLDRIADYLAGDDESFRDVTVALTVPTNQRRVLETVQSVPYGESVTVEQILRMTPGLDADDLEDRSVVETALRENPAPILIPDHRVEDGPHSAPPDVLDVLRRVEGI